MNTVAWLFVVAGAALAQPQADFFVAPGGNDSASGNIAAPFATVTRAQAAVRELAGKKPVHVILRGGTYFLPGTLRFTSADSGTADAPVTWENYPGETPVISGGLRIGAWKKTSGSLWQVKLPSSVKPFEYLFYNGERRLRARVESAAGVGYYMKDGACMSTQTGKAVETSQCNLGTFLRVGSETPPGNTACPSISNKSSASQSKCMDRFEYNPDDPIVKWKNLNGVYTGDPAHPCKSDTANPFPEGDIELTLFEAWTVEMMRVGCVDPASHIIFFTSPTRTRASSVYNFFGPTKGHRYVVENARDAFESARAAGQTGLWFLDRSTAPWTLNYLANRGEDPNRASLVIAQIGPVSVTGGSLLHAEAVDYVTFRGITFEVDNYVPPADGFKDDENGESTLPAAVDCESCRHVTFDSIVVRHTSSSGIQIASASGNSGPAASDDVIQNSAFYDIGDSGIHIGHHPVGGDRAANVVQNVRIENNIVQGFARVFANGEGIAEGNGHDITYAHNDINDGYHAGISICLIGCPGQNGANIVTQYNHIWNVLQGITNDGGTLYYNTSRATGVKVLNNLLHDVTDSSIIDPPGTRASGYGGHGIYMDIESAGKEVRDNVVFRVSDSGIFVGLGPANGQPPNTFANNIVAYARRAMFENQMPWTKGCGDHPTLKNNVTNNIFYFDRAPDSGFQVIQGCAYSCGLSFDQFQNFQGNLYWRTDGNLANDPKAFHVLKKAPGNLASCGRPANPDAAWTPLTFAEWRSAEPHGSAPAMKEDLKGTVSVDPKFGHTGKPADFLLSSNPVEGFDYTRTNDTIRKAGRTHPVIMPPKVMHTYPTYSYTEY